MLAEVCRSMLDDQDMVSALRGRIGDMQERCGRIEARARKKRELVCTVMEAIILVSAVLMLVYLVRRRF
jgi:hypothetical protein